MLQDAFLSQLKNSETPVSVFLVNGIKLHGTIHDYNEHVILLKSAQTQMIFNHAISTVVPSKPA